MVGFKYLRGNVVWCATECGGTIFSEHVLFAHSEVCNFHMAISIQHHII